MISREELLSLFDYDKEKGVITWKVARSNAVKVGDQPSYINNSGYFSVRLNGKHVLVHRIIWMIEFGEVPKY